MQVKAGQENRQWTQCVKRSRDVDVCGNEGTKPCLVWAPEHCGPLSHHSPSPSHWPPLCSLTKSQHMAFACAVSALKITPPTHTHRPQHIVSLFLLHTFVQLPLPQGSGRAACWNTAGPLSCESSDALHAIGMGKEEIKSGKGEGKQRVMYTLVVFVF